MFPKIKASTNSMLQSSYKARIQKVIVIKKVSNEH